MEQVRFSPTAAIQTADALWITALRCSGRARVSRRLLNGATGAPRDRAAERVR